MALDPKKLEKGFDHMDGTVTYRCPACAEQGHDKKGNHLFIKDGERYGCIMFQGTAGAYHRKRINQLAGDGVRSPKYGKINLKREFGRTATKPAQPATPAGPVARAGAASTAIAFLADDRRRIQLPGDGRLLSDYGTELADGLQSANLFTRAGRVFTINAAGDGLAQVSAEGLRTMVELHLCCYKVRQAGTNTVIEANRTMAVGDAAGVLASPQFLNRLRPIERVNPIPMPVRRADGCIELLQLGYDAQAKTFTCDSSIPIVAMNLDMARTIINDLLAEFVFGDNGRSKAVAISAMLGVFGAGLLPPKSLRPCFVYVANAEGAGKSLLVKCAVVPVLGSCPTSSKAKDEDELRKMLLAAVLEARPVLVLDNIKGGLASESLEGFLSASDWSGRVLGETASFTGSNNTTIFVTGNGCTVSPDMRRRSLFSELRLEVERAEDKIFKNQLEAPELIERRSEILSALWAFIRDWHAAGEPKPSRGHSAFSSWATIFGGIVEHIGFGCPLATAEIPDMVDTDAADMRALVEAMLPNGDLLNALPFDEVITLVRQHGLFDSLVPSVGDLERKDRATLGGLLRSYDKRIVGDCRFSLIGSGHRRRYQAERTTA